MMNGFSSASGKLNSLELTDVAYLNLFLYISSFSQFSTKLYFFHEIKEKNK